ncbi:conserved protein of unknown function [Tenacibaculum sp. 190130A14a]|uniref:Uncharacterized protein n=1 Tax=Tenacibaculum polynesiense TaxID=3137857 RepID=A0ABM9P754_9FLAO
MNVTLKLKPTEVFSIQEILKGAFESPVNFYSLNSEEKLRHSIGTSLYDTFTRKTMNLKSKMDLITSSKSTQLTLKHHEAWALKSFLRNHISLLETDLEILGVQKAIGFLDQNTL